MTDSRVKYLKFVEGSPLTFSCISTGILCSSSVTGLLVEENQVCRPDLRLWLIVVIIRSACRLFCRLYLAWKLTEVDRIMMRGDLHASAKCVDILDVFGIVWFAVGNLLVFNNFDCIGASPIVFFSSLSYVCFSYVGFFLPSVLRCSLGICRPTHEADIQYLRQTADADREIGMINLRNNEAGRGPAGVNAMYSPELTPERAQYWATWLEGYGCFAVSYHSSMNLREKSGTAAAMSNSNNGSSIHINNHNHDESGSDNVGQRSPATSVHGTAYTALTATGDVNVDLESGVHTGNNYSAQDHQEDHQQDGTQGRSAAYWHIPADQPDEGDYCSVCLMPFETVEQSSAGSAGGSVINGSVHNGTGSSGAASAAVSTSTGVEGQAPVVGEEPAAVVENNNIIVRYPCVGHHYFHAHCLHSWLQVASARYLNTRRGGRLSTSEDHTLQVTCPCCREHPHNIANIDIVCLEEGVPNRSVSVDSNSNTSGGGVNVRVSHSSGTSNNAYLGLQVMR